MINEGWTKNGRHGMVNGNRTNAPINPIEQFFLLCLRIGGKVKEEANKGNPFLLMILLHVFP